MVSCVIFDLGGTLYESEEGVAKGNDLRFKEMQKMDFDISRRKYDRLIAKTSRKFNEKYHKSVERFEDGNFMDIFFDLLGRNVDPDTKRELDEVFFEGWFECQELKPDAREALEFCEERDLKMGIITNGDEGMTSRIDRDGIRHYFDVVVYSADIGVEKSGIDPFKVFLDRMDIDGEECLMVGNRMDEDMHAKKLGMKTVLIGGDGEWTMGEKEEPDFRIDELTELKEIILKLLGEKNSCNT